MEHPCKKCGAEVEDGTPFCPQCNAPQIRVHSSAVEPGTQPLPPGTPGDVQPPAEPISREHRSAPPPLTWGKPLVPGKIRLKYAIPGALILALLAIVGSVTQFPPFVLLCIVAGGGLAVAIYHRLDPAMPLRAGSGFRIGALAGGIGFLLNAVLNAISLATPAGREALRTMMKTSMESSNLTGEQAEQMRKLIEELNTPAGMASFFIVAMLFAGVLFLLLSGLGGTVGASLFGRREPRN